MVVGPILCPALVGRADELHELTRRRLSASKGHGGLVLVTGDGGIGKSRLISAFREELAGRRTGFGIGYCRPTGNAPYAPFREAARGIGSALDVTALNRDERLALLADAVAGACRRRNAVLVIEDAHWADTGSLNLISHLLPSLRSLPLLLVVTYRTDLTLDAQAAPYFARFQRHCAAEIALGPLSPSDMRLLLRLAIAKSHRVRAQRLDEVIARAEGNPFFAEELLKSLLMRGHARRTNALPPTIRAVVEERLHELGEPYVRIAMCASVLGRSIDPSLLAQLSEPSDGDVLVALGRMRDLQIVEQPAESGNLLAFRHSLMREAIYRRMLPQQAQLLHARVLHLLEGRSGSNVYDLAYQAWAAGDADRCAFYNERAGDEAEALHDHADAARCYQRAARSAHSSEARMRLFEKAADACARDGKAERAADLYERAAEGALRCGDDLRAATLRGAMARELRRAGNNEHAIDVLTQTIESLEVDDARLRSELLLDLAFSRLDQADTERAAVLLAQAERASDPGSYWKVVAYACAIDGDVAGMRKATARRIQASHALGRIPELYAQFNLAFWLCALGFDREALDIFQKILPICAPGTSRRFSCSRTQTPPSSIAALAISWRREN